MGSSFSVRNRHEHAVQVTCPSHGDAYRRIVAPGSNMTYEKGTLSMSYNTIVYCEACGKHVTRWCYNHAAANYSNQYDVIEHWGFPRVCAGTASGNATSGQVRTAPSNSESQLKKDKEKAQADLKKAKEAQTTLQQSYNKLQTDLASKVDKAKKDAEKATREAAKAEKDKAVSEAEKKAKQQAQQEAEAQLAAARQETNNAKVQAEDAKKQAQKDVQAAQIHLEEVEARAIKAEEERLKAEEAKAKAEAAQAEAESAMRTALQQLNVIHDKMKNPSKFAESRSELRKNLVTALKAIPKHYFAKTAKTSLGIIGNRGAGKSSLLNMLMGAEDCDDGICETGDLDCTQGVSLVAEGPGIEVYDFQGEGPDKGAMQIKGICQLFQLNYVLIAYTSDIEAGLDLAKVAEACGTEPLLVRTQFDNVRPKNRDKVKVAEREAVKLAGYDHLKMFYASSIDTTLFQSFKEDLLSETDGEFSFENVEAVNPPHGTPVELPKDAASILDAGAAPGSNAAPIEAASDVRSSDAVASSSDAARTVLLRSNVPAISPSGGDDGGESVYSDAASTHDVAAAPSLDAVAPSLDAVGQLI